MRANVSRARNRRKATHPAPVVMTIPGQTRVVLTVQMFRFVTPPSLRLLVPRDTLARPFHSSSSVIGEWQCATLCLAAVGLVLPPCHSERDADVVAGRPSELAYRIPARPTHRAAPRALQRVPAPAGSRSKTLWMRTRSMNAFRIRQLLGSAAAILLL